MLLKHLKYVSNFETIWFTKPRNSQKMSLDQLENKAVCAKNVNNCGLKSGVLVMFVNGFVQKFILGI